MNKIKNNKLTTSAFISVFRPPPIVLGFLSPGNIIVVFLPPLFEVPEKRLFVPVCIIDVDMFVIVVVSDEIEDC
jgi:hypothetical protein